MCVGLSKSFGARLLMSADLMLFCLMSVRAWALAAPVDNELISPAMNSFASIWGLRLRYASRVGTLLAFASRALVGKPWYSLNSPCHRTLAAYAGSSGR